LPQTVHNQKQQQKNFWISLMHLEFSLIQDYTDKQTFK